MKRYLFIIFTLTLSQIAAAKSLTLESKVQDKINDLDQQQKIIQRTWELEQERLKDSAIAVAGKEGFAIQSGDKKFQLKLKGFLQADGRFFVKQPENTGNHTFLIRRARPILEGTVFNNFDFKFVPDFGNGTATIQDAYIDSRVAPWFKIRLGKFKAPIGLERLQPSNSNIFAETGLATSLVPNYDVGAQVLGDIQEGVVSYAVSVANGVPDGSSGDLESFNGKEIAGRIFTQPFLKSSIDSLKGFGIGFAGSYGKQTASSSSPGLPTYKTAGQQTFFRYNNTAASGSTPANISFVKDNIVRFSPQAYYFYGPFGLLGEYVQSRQGVQNGASGDTLKNQAWQVITTYALTGDKASYKGLKVKNPLNPKEVKWGAVELAARYNELRIDQDAFSTFASATSSAQRARGFGGGVNWYLNDNIKIVTDYENTTFLGGSSSGNRQSEHVVQSRLQLTF